MNNKYEILAPAGNFESLTAAVQNGANAVYLSGKDFGARKFANNFSDQELIEAIKYCHIRDVDVYVTINTLILNHEFDKLKKYIDFLYTIGVDAVIVQDIGVLEYIRKTYKDLEIHCSTQMSVQTVEDIKYLESLGANRVVLGREMPLEDIKRAKEETNVELEVFIHGALCISVSGQCLMSSMIGGRSGNRGSCAQPCRQKYKLYNVDENKKIASFEGDYILSPKDLYTLDEVVTIIEAGGYSLKIEGRMKSPEYVATVVKSYKTMIEGVYAGKNPDTNDLEKELKIFNRGFTKGHLFHENGPNLMSAISPGNQGYFLGKVIKYDNKSKQVTISLSENINHNDEIQIRRKDEIVGGRVEKLQFKGKVVKNCKKGMSCEVNFKHSCKPGEEVYKTYDEELMKITKQTFAKETLEIPITIEVTIKRDRNIISSISDGQNTIFEETNHMPENAIKRAITAEDVNGQLSKLGGTPYRLVDIKVVVDDDLSVPMKIINGIRRTLVEKLDKKRGQKYKRSSKLNEINNTVVNYKNTHPKKTVKTIELTYAVSNLSQLNEVLGLGGEIIYYKDLETLAKAVELTKQKDFKGKLIPEIFKLLSYYELKKYKKLIKELNLDTVLIQSYGHIDTFKGFSLIADFNLNIINDYSYRFYIKNGLGCFGRITLSPELNLAQISSMDLSHEKTEIFGFGYIPVMAMKHCVISTTHRKQKNCGLCYNNNYAITDKMNEEFKIKRRYQCNTEIYNSKKLLLIEDSKKLEEQGVGYFRLNFIDESPQEVGMIVKTHQKVISNQLTPKDYETLREIKKTGVTKGHLNRGIVI